MCHYFVNIPFNALLSDPAVTCSAGQYKQVDAVGTVNLIEAAKKTGVKKFVLLTSLLTNAKAIGQSDNPSYKFLNVSPNLR